MVVVMRILTAYVVLGATYAVRELLETSGREAFARRRKRGAGRVRHIRHTIDSLDAADPQLENVVRIFSVSIVMAVIEKPAVDAAPVVNGCADVGFPDVLVSRRPPD